MEIRPTKPMRLSLLAVALVALLAACGSTSADDGPTDPTDVDTTVTVSDMAFDRATVTVAARDAIRIALVNEDPMPHNIAIYIDESKSEKLYEGEMVTGDTIAYQIPNLEAGEYFFGCSLHPTMTGTLVVEG
jgi:plastocyanin